MLVDTGAALSIISKEIFDELDLCDHTLKKITLELKTADGDSLHVYGKTEVVLLLENQSFSIPVIVADLGGLSGIMGIDFLAQQKVLFDLREGILIFPDFQVILKSEENLGCARVYLENDITIAGQTEILVKGSVANSSFTSNEGIVERTICEGSCGQVVIPNSLVDVQNDSQPKNHSQPK